MTSVGNRIVPSLLAQDIRTTVSFYTDTLGFKLTGAHPDRDKPTWIEVTRDGVALQFYQHPPHGTPEKPILSGTLYLFPDSVSALADELRGKVTFEWGPEVMGYGMLEFAIRDCNGYYLAFTEPA